MVKVVETFVKYLVSESSPVIITFIVCYHLDIIGKLLIHTVSFEINECKIIIPYRFIDVCYCMMNEFINKYVYKYQ